jgi:hypothetical protein
MVKIKIRDLSLKHAGWQDEAAVSSPVKWYEIQRRLEEEESGGESTSSWIRTQV